MKSFARVSKLSNIGGRADYITNPKRQENIVATSEKIDWKPYQDFERNNQKTFTANNEGREVILAIPNEWSKLPQHELMARAQTLAAAAVGKETDMQWAIHWNKSKTNLHMHVIFSERQKCGEVGRYDRDIYLTADGKVARSKAQRAKNADGSYKPPKHRKGDFKGDFTVKDTRYKQKSWSYDMKNAVNDVLRHFKTNLEPRATFSQYHEGKGKYAPLVARKNAAIRVNNELFSNYLKNNVPISRDFLKNRMIEASKDGKVFLLMQKEDGKWQGISLTVEKWWERLREAEQRKQAAQTATAKPMDELPTQPIKPKLPTTPPIPWQIAPIKKALNDLETAIKKKNQPSAAANVSRFKFKEHKAAKALDEKRISAAYAEIATATSTLKAHGVSMSDIPVYSLTDITDVAKNVEHRITALETEDAESVNRMSFSDFEKQVKEIRAGQPLDRDRGHSPRPSTHER